MCAYLCVVPSTCFTVLLLLLVFKLCYTLIESAATILKPKKYKLDGETHK